MREIPRVFPSTGLVNGASSSQLEMKRANMDRYCFHRTSPMLYRSGCFPWPGFVFLTSSVSTTSPSLHLRYRFLPNWEQSRVHSQPLATSTSTHGSKFAAVCLSFRWLWNTVQVQYFPFVACAPSKSRYLSPYGSRFSKSRPRFRLRSKPPPTI